MKIAILGFAKLKYLPCLQYSLDRFNRERDEIHLIYWRRDTHPDIPLPEGVIGHALDMPMTDSLPLWRKAPYFLRYRLFAQRLLHRIQPDKLVVLQSTTAVTVYDLLVGRYSGRYALSYLDMTYEHRTSFRLLINNLVHHSAVTFTSSDGFRVFLPDSEKLITVHNITMSLVKNREDYRRPREKHQPIRIAFWGLMRHREINAKIIERLGNDARFELHYYGRAQGKMLMQVQQAVATYDNVFYHGEYLPQDRPAIAENTDMIHNIYFEGEGASTSFAMSNKYYDGILFGLPQLCMRYSLMGNQCAGNGVGLDCDPREESFADNLYTYYQGLDMVDFLSCCDRELDRVAQQMQRHHTFFD